jgi:hypothetical protein
MMARLIYLTRARLRNGENAMPFDVFMKVQYNDAGNFIMEKRYLLDTQLLDDFSNLDDVNTNGEAVLGILNTLSWDNLNPVTYEIVIPNASAAANVASNNSIEAFLRLTDDVTGKPSHLQVPAWDDVVYDKLPNNTMSSAFNTAAENIAGYTRNPVTGNAWTYIGAVNRGNKKGQRGAKI